MKKKLNILCVLVFCVLTLTLSESFYATWWGLSEGFMAGPEAKENHVENPAKNLSALSLYPEGFVGTSDSLYNSKSGGYVPIWPVNMMVSIETHIPWWLQLVRVLCALAMFVYGVKAIIRFVRLVRAINRSEIFCWSNVRLLRRLGKALSFVFLGNFIFTLVDTFALRQVLSIPGYSYNYLSVFSDANLLLGVLSFVVAEIFSIGLKMKEEQDLTI